MKRPAPIVFAAMALALSSRPIFADNPERPAVLRGVDFLKSKVSGMSAGEAAISALAMKKAEVPVTDPGLVACIARFGSNFNGTTYTPEAKTGADIYEASVTIMAMVNIDPEGYKPYIEAAARFLLEKQMPNGAWDYSNRNAGDTSISQYALLGLWEAENVGVTVSPSVWDRSARWFLSVQASSGSWNYHRDEPTWKETLAMTGAGVGSLLLCQSQLIRHRKGQESINPLMTPLVVDGIPAEARYKVETSSASVRNGIKNGARWMAENFQTTNNEIVGQSIYYALYGIERVGALSKQVDLGIGDKAVSKKAVNDKDILGNIDWYQRGLQFCLSTQKTSGAWDAVQHKEIPNTCWAILFTTRATEKSVTRIEFRRLGAGRLVGNRTLPTNLENVEVVNGRLVVKPMGGAIDGMLAALEDPKDENTESALKGLVEKYQTEGPKALRPHKARLRKLLKSPDPFLRLVAVWGLGRTGDLDVAPAIIKAIVDPDELVVDEARVSLMVLSRKLDGYGPERKASIEDRHAAALRWQAWFESVKPPDMDAPDELPVSVRPTPAPAK